MILPSSSPLPRRPLTLFAYSSLFTYAITVTLLGPVLSPLQQALGLSSTQIGELLSLFALFFTLSVYAAGSISPRLGFRTIFSLGLGCLSLGLLLILSARSPLSLGLALSILGVSGGTIEAATNTLIGSLYPQTSVKDLNLLHIYFGLGALVGPLLSGISYHWIPLWNLSYAVPFALSLPLLVHLCRLPFPATADAPFSFAELVLLFKKPLSVLLGFAMALYVMSEVSINSFGPRFLEEVHHLSPLRSSLNLSLFWGAITLGRLATARLAAVLRGTLLLFLMALCGTLATLLFHTSSPSWLWSSAAGFCYGGVMPTLVALGTQRFPRQVGPVNGLLMMYLGLGLIAAPYLVGILADLFTLRIGMLTPILSFGVLTLLSLSLLNASDF